MALRAPSTGLLHSLRCALQQPRRAGLTLKGPSYQVRGIASFTHTHQANAISVLPTTVDTSSADFQENAKQMDEVLQKMNELHAKIAQGGSQKARDKHIARGKMLL
ncbi:hypothetical protein FQN49_008919 [Arthroderma sp. PD_2]|nr:hypothetical protein FQN49_008919 [Arthroderma sp. PD_2]